MKGVCIALDKYLSEIGSSESIETSTDLSALSSFDSPTKSIQRPVRMMLQSDAILWGIDSVQDVLWSNTTTREFFNRMQCLWLRRVTSRLCLWRNNETHLLLNRIGNNMG